MAPDTRTDETNKTKKEEEVVGGLRWSGDAWELRMVQPPLDKSFHTPPTKEKDAKSTRVPPWVSYKLTGEAEPLAL